jgi:phosphoribosylaminoimidazolecarboxamide formyltransferase/IMP cyclohydrolase
MERSIRRALVSVYDKQGVVALCRELHAAGVEILSSGGTARLLDSEGVPVVRVAEYTGSPEILDGRVKTLHPRIHAGILAVRSSSEHMDELGRHQIEPIDLVVVNLYPFRETVASPDASHDQIVEMIDIGGPTLIRAASKNYRDVGVVVDPSDYDEILSQVREHGALSDELRERLAVKAFRHTSTYDSAIHDYLSSRTAADGAEPSADPFPDRFTLELHKAQDLRYGENPHQRAAFYREAASSSAFPSVAHGRQLQGKELSFNNLLDFDAALNLAADLRDGACVVVKHGNPCGVALGLEPGVAFRRALECDPVSAFGGVIAFNRPVDAAAAKAITEAFYEGVIAPAFDADSREVLAKKKKLRVLATGDLTGYTRHGFDVRRVNGGVLLQDWDPGGESVRDGEVATQRKPSDEEWRALEFAWTVVRHVKSNAIVFGNEDRLLGVGAGQMSRVDSVRIGIEKARVPLDGAVMASDAFFPFRDGVDVAAEAGVKAVVQPGGSIRDKEVVAAANEHGIAMVFTGRRHFRH